MKEAPKSPADVCEFCDDTGYETFDESDGEGHITRGTGTRRCRHLTDD